MLSRLPLYAVLAAAAVLLTASPAFADGLGHASCEQDDPGCTARAKSHDIVEPARSANVRPAGAGGDDGSGTPETCRDPMGEKVPCYIEGLGWLASDGCYYQQTDYSPSSPEIARTLGKTGDGPGAWYQFTCPDVLGTGGGIRWLPRPPGGGQADRVPPVVVARRARDRMELPSPVIHASPAPSELQLVRLPTWLWIDAATWGQRSASASAGPVSVTVTATPRKVMWSMGDGARVVCHGPGTPYQPGTDPSRPSPTCGHTYTESSAGEPGGAYQVTATITWEISWSGGGQQGSLQPLTTTASTSFRVAESQGIVTDSTTH